jgi:epidermal growth factor receptor substrate 15
LKALGHPNLNLSAEEKRLFGQVFAAADTESLGVVTGDIAFKFFPERTKLPAEILGEIWQLADAEDKGFLTPAGFGIVLRLIGYAQAGRQPSAELALKPGGPLPKFAGINAPAAPSAAAPLQAQASGGGPIRVPPLAADKANSYATLFEHSEAQDGLLNSSTAKQIFDRAQLPNDVLARIWNLADTEQRGALNVTEFIIAMHLLASFRTGAMRALPQNLPAGLYEAATRRGMPPRQMSGSRPVSDSTPASAISRQFSGGAPPRTSSPLTRPPQAPPAFVDSQSTVEWIISPAEKTQYDNQFAVLDAGHRGFVTGDQAVGFFSRSNLPEDDLAQIWDLADINSQGQLSLDEFAVAMHLIRQQLGKKGPLPQTLPQNLVPPSMRKQTTAPLHSTAPIFDVPVSKPKSAAEDLFGLDAFSDPPSAKPLQTQVLQPQSAGASASPVQIVGTASPSQPRSQPQTIFKPFVPTSSFGQKIAPQTTGLASSVTSEPQARSLFPQNDDLLGDADPEISKKLTTETSELGNLSNQVSSLTTQMQQVKQKRGSTEQEFNQMSTQKRDFETRLSQLRSAYEQEARDVKSLEDRLAVARSETQKAQQDLAMVQHSYQNLQEQHQQIMTALQTDQQENANLKQRISQVNTEIIQLKPQLEKMQSDARQQKGLVAINKKQLSTVEAQRERLKAEMDAATKEHQDAIRELEESERTLQASREAEERDRALKAAQAQEQAALRATREREAAAAKANRQETLTARSLETENLPVTGTTDAAAAGATLAAPIAATIPLPESKVVSPAASVASPSTNPFFRRATGTSERGLSQSSMSPEPIASPNYNAFDSFFAPVLASTDKSTAPAPMPATSFGDVAAPQSNTFAAEEPAVTGGETQNSAQPAHDAAFMMPASQMPRAYSATSSVDVMPPTSRQGGASGMVSPGTERTIDQAMAPATASSLEQSLHDASGEEPCSTPAASGEHDLQTRTNVEGSRPVYKHTETEESASDQHMPGSFPGGETTHFFSPASTNQQFGNIDNTTTGSAVNEHATHDDPFAVGSGESSGPSTTEEPTSTFESKLDKGKGVVRPGASEFPPIQEFGGDDSDSDDEHGFSDSFTAASPPRNAIKASQGEEAVKEMGLPTTTASALRPDASREVSNVTTELPTPNAQVSPPTYSQVISPVAGATDHRDSNQFPPEFGGLLPSREPPVTSPSVQSPPEALRSTSNGTEAVSYFGGVPFANDHGVSTSPLPPIGQSKEAASAKPAVPPKNDFDDFDNAFSDLSEAQAGDEKLEDDFASPHREGIDEFNPTFDSPAPSRATMSTMNHESSVFSDFENTITSGSQTSAFGTAPPATTSNQEWDAMFADFGSTAQTNGNGTAKPHEELINEAFGNTSATPKRPALGRAITTGTEHDDPILKRLTGMGYPREESLQALEKFDYNLDKVRSFV